MERMSARTLLTVAIVAGAFVMARPDARMPRSNVAAALSLGVLSSACAQLAGMDMRKAEIGMTREQAKAAMPGTPTTYTLTRIREISPAFVLREWQAKDPVHSYSPDKP